MHQYIDFTIAAALPAVIAVLLFYLNEKGRFSNIPPHLQKILPGIIFGLLAIIGTERGIPVHGAQVNCRDAAVLIGGLVFGPEAGLISGFIGGTERWIAVAWGIGTQTRVACTLSTYFAGIFSAAISHFLLERKRPNCWMAFFVAVSVEAFHLTMVFLTNMDNAVYAIKVVRKCTVPMLVANGLSVFAAVHFIALLSHETNYFHLRLNSETPVFETIQRAMLQVIVVCLCITLFFVYTLENNLAESETEYLLTNAINDASTELNDKISPEMIRECEFIDLDMDSVDEDLDPIVDLYRLSEIFLVDTNGIVINTNVSGYIGHDMTQDPQFKDFTCLLDDEITYVADGSAATDPNSYREIVGIQTSYGYLQVSYDVDVILDFVSIEIYSIAVNRHIGKHGFIVITDDDGNILSSSTGVSQNEMSDWFLQNISISSEMRKATIGTDSYYYLSMYTDGNIIWGFYPVLDANIQQYITFYLTIFIIILIFMSIYLMLYILIKNIIVNQVVDMANSLSRISSGNLDEVLDVRSNAEFASLSRDINGTVDTLKQYISDAASRIDSELRNAAQIQSSALPNADLAFPKRKDFEIAAKMAPAKEVGGDFYDFYLTDQNEMNIMIADVSGKGIPAAMFMMRAKSTLKELTEAGFSVNEAFTEGNNHLCMGNDAEMFVTAWQGCVNLETGLVEYANAGHNPPLVKHGDAPFEYLKQKRNLVLGAMEDIQYKKYELQLHPGDILLLYTDGVVEATNNDNELYGEQRLLDILNTHRFSSMRDMLMYIRKDVDSFVGDAPQFDDMTMLAFKYNE